MGTTPSAGCWLHRETSGNWRVCGLPSWKRRYGTPVSVPDGGGSTRLAAGAPLRRRACVARRRFVEPHHTAAFPQSVDRASASGAEGARMTPMAPRMRSETSATVRGGFWPSLRPKVRCGRGPLFEGYRSRFGRSKTTLEGDLEELRRRGLVRFEGEKRTGRWRLS